MLFFATNNTDVQGSVEMIVFFDRPLTSAEARALYENPYVIFAPRMMPSLTSFVDRVIEVPTGPWR